MPETFMILSIWVLKEGSQDCLFSWPSCCILAHMYLIYIYIKRQRCVCMYIRTRKRMLACTWESEGIWKPRSYSELLRSFPLLIHPYLKGCLTNSQLPCIIVLDIALQWLFRNVHGLYISGRLYLWHYMSISVSFFI